MLVQSLLDSASLQAGYFRVDPDVTRLTPLTVTNIDEALVTGESLPVSKRPGDGVIAGSINRSGSVRFRFQNTGAVEHDWSVREIDLAIAILREL
jgi:hypothetical protein